MKLLFFYPCPSVSKGHSRCRGRSCTCPFLDSCVSPVFAEDKAFRLAPHKRATARVAPTIGRNSMFKFFAMIMFADRLGLCPNLQLGVSPPTPPLGETPRPPCKNTPPLQVCLFHRGFRGDFPLMGSGVKPQQWFGDSVPNLLSSR